MPLARDDELVVALGAEQHDAVEAVAAVDRDRRVHDVLDEVAALAGVDRGLLVDGDEGADDERVVALLAVEG